MADGTGLEEVTAVVGLLDGVPLAIELAAARLNAFSVGELFDVLQLDLGGLSDARRRGPDRQRTLRAAVEWSMRLLSGSEQAVLRQLAVLPGSFRLTTALAVSPPAAGALPSLVDHSLAAIEHRTGPLATACWRRSERSRRRRSLTTSAGRCSTGCSCSASMSWR